nr:unnamed protein product [Callosobruchus chinensis]
MLDLMAKTVMARVFENCPLRKAVESGSIVLPEETNLPGSTILAPYVFLGDEAFPLTEYLMRPFPRGQLQEGEENDMFNYRLCRARMVVECSFGAIASKFRILQKAIETNVENAVHIVKAITLLHNIIKDLKAYLTWIWSIIEALRLIQEVMYHPAEFIMLHQGKPFWLERNFVDFSHFVL